MTRWMLVFILFLLKPLSASAQMLCSDFLIPNSLQVEAADEKDLKPDSYNRVLKVVESMLGKLQAPYGEKILIQKNLAKSDAVERNPLLGSITVAASKRMKITAILLSHEYGHAIFDWNLGRRNAKYKQIPALYVLMTTQDVALQTEFQKLVFVLRAFHELFADTTAVVAMKDLSADYRAAADGIVPPENSSVDDLLKFWEVAGSRNFARAWDKDSEAVWKAVLSRNKTHLDPYLWLVPARSFLGEKLGPLLKDRQRRRHILEQVFEVLYSELDEIMKNDSYDAFINDPMAYNLKLKDRFSQIH